MALDNFVTARRNLRPYIVGLPVGACIIIRDDLFIPNNFALCDGSVISDSESPLNGETLPSTSDLPTIP